MKIRTLLTLVAAVQVLPGAGAQAPRPKPALTDVAAFNETAPDVYRVLFVTSAGSFAVRVTRAWSPRAADRFYNNSRLDKDGFAPFGEVVPSMLIVERIYSVYGEGPEQSAILAGGNLFLNQHLPRLDYITSATVEQ